jgi:hypothetical protein
MKRTKILAVVVLLALAAFALRYLTSNPSDPARAADLAARPSRLEVRESRSSDKELNSMLAELLRTPVEPRDALAELEGVSDDASSETPTELPEEIEELVLLDREPNLSRVADAETEFARGEWADGARQFEARQTRLEDGTWRLNGEWRAWYPNGTLEELGGYRDDREHGEWSWWYANGEPMAKGAFKDGERIGAWTFWHPSGVVIGEGSYERGLRSGRWTFRLANGETHSEYSGVYDGGYRVAR